MNIILFSIPLFFLLIGIELIAERIRGTEYYRINDSLTSLATGVINRLVSVSKKMISFTFYALIWHQFSVFDLGDSWLVWVVAFVLYDLCYYWNHRMCHEMNILWASHVVHHSSEEYNLTTALRQTSTGVMSFIFYLPMALMGFDPLLVLSVGAINLVYQFWVHTRHIEKLGWFELFFVTPSNHRAHHAQNPVYIDKNYGGVFIIWDRIFGTFQEELKSEPVIFGITGAVKSWNPLWVNAQVYAQLMHDTWFTKSWWHKCTLWFRRTGWRPDDVAQRFPLDKVDLSQFEKFDLPLPNTLKLYSLVQYVQVASLFLYFSIALTDIIIIDRLYIACFIVFGLLGIGAVMEGKHYAGVFEWMRNALLLLMIMRLPEPLAYWLAGITCLCVPLLFIGRQQHERFIASQSATEL